jgi:ketose-bisphosphate aldolase
MPLEPIYELTGHASKNGYAIGYFESWNLESLQGVIDAAEQTRSPVIIGFNGQFLSDPGRQVEERLSWYGALGNAAAQSASVPCGFILNECAENQWVLRAVTAGFNLVMPVDSKASSEDFRQRVKDIVDYAHAYGVAVEAEIDELPFGSDGIAIGAASPGIGVESGRRGSAVQLHSSSRTDPLRAAAFVDATDVDLLAVSVGNVHISLNGRNGLDLDRLVEIRNAVDVPLVLHGGTGISDHSLRKAVKLGVAKVNFGTYLKQRYLAAVRNALGNDQANPHFLMGSGGRDDVMVEGRRAVRDAVLERIHLLGCCGKA